MSGNQNTLLRKFRGQWAGFGLIELLVSISIMVMVIGTVLARQDAFNSASLLRAEAYDLALQIREIQLIAVSSEARGGGASTFRSVYGVYFTSADRGQYIPFRDAGIGNNFYNPGEELPSIIKLDPRFTISEIRTYDPTLDQTDPPELSIIYQRPNFDARFNQVVNAPVNGVTSVEIDVALRSDPATFKTVEITKTGQISVK